MPHPASSAFSRLLLTFALALGCLTVHAQTENNSPANPDLGKPFATVNRLKGDVFAISQQGNERKLREGSPVSVGERIKAAANGEAVLKTQDGGLIAVRPAAEFMAERYAAEGKASDRQWLRLISGSLRLISGWIAQHNRDEHKVITPSATIGIRGTDHEPYVLAADQASEQYAPGTYDKVNRGGTTLEANGGSVDIDPGKVGFARDAKSGKRTRALFTLLLPSLLDRIPEFYVPGSFDGELDRYAAQQEKTAPLKSSATPSQLVTPPTPNPAPSPAANASQCKAQQIGEQWLKQLDAALLNRDLRSLLNLFAQDVVASATVRRSDGESEVSEFNRDELVKSTLEAIAGLQDFQQRRLNIQGKVAAGSSDCRQIEVSSRVIEQGKLGGKAYRIEAIEDYQLEWRDGAWVAVSARTRQR